MAKPKEVLVAFGGNMNIEEYRKDFWIIKHDWDIVYDKPIEITQNKAALRVIHPPFAVKTNRRMNQIS